MASPLASRFARAAIHVEAFLRRQSARVDELPTSHEFPKGWSITVPINGADTTLHALLPRDFPSAPPRVRVVPAEKFHRRVPHVEEDGLLCLYPSGSEFNLQDDAGGIAPTWTRAHDLLEKPDLSEFFDEFPSYWRQAIGPRREALSLFNGEIPVVSHALMDSKTVVVGPEEAALKRWWKHSKGDPKVLPPSTPVHRVDFKSPQYPFQFPKTVAEFFTLIRAEQPELADSFLQVLTHGARPSLVVCRIPAPRGHVEGIIELPALQLGQREAISRGFRSGRTPLRIVEQRAQGILRQSLLSRLTLQPVRHDYIHSRGGNGTNLAEKTLVVIGCGSLGGYVAHFFAKAGVGRIILIDHETLSWDNAGRHILGGRFVGLSKAKSLGHLLRSEMPHLRVESHACSWRELYDFQSLLFSNSDLVVSTVGSWTAEHDLNWLLRKSTAPAAGLFTWLEPHAVAGHAMLVHPTQGGCMNCVMDPWGAFQRRTFDSPAQNQPQPAGCAGTYQPYGVAEMVPIASMAVQQGVDYLVGRVTASEIRSWLGARSLFEQHGITPLSAWAAKLEQQPLGSVHRETPDPSTHCRCCH